MLPPPAGDVRDLYLRVATLATELVTDPRVAEHWDDGSVLAQFRVSGLAGHLARSIFQVEWYLDSPLSPLPGSPPVTASRYYADLVGVADPDSELNVAVRRRGDEMATEGPTALGQRAVAALARLRVRLTAEAGDRRVEARGRVLLLDEYLKTRLVEITVHMDDLVLSVESIAPEVPAGAYAVAIQTLVGAATLRHGDLAVLRGLTRSERQGTEVLRVL